MDGTTYNSDAAYIQAAATILGSAINAYSVSQTDKEDRKFMKNMDDKHRAWALEDYQRVQQDSSPAAQVQRLKDAGLNPNLVYGTGPMSTGKVEMPRDVSTPAYHHQPWQLDLAHMNAVGQYLDILAKKAAIENVQAETEKTKSETTGQNISNDFESSVASLRVSLMQHQDAAVLKEMEKMDNDIKNNNLLTQNTLKLTDEQINSIIQARFVQIQELDLTRKQIGAQIKQGYMHAQAELLNAKANQNNAAANMIRANSEAVRNSKLNELTDSQIGTMALEYQRLQNDMQYDFDRHKHELSGYELEEAKKKAWEKTNESWNRNFGWTGLSFDAFRSLIPFAPSVSVSSPTKAGGTSTVKL